MEAAAEQSERQELVNQIKTSAKSDINNLIIHIIKEKATQEQDPRKIYDFFSYIYDTIYHDILFKKIRIKKQMVRILERLAMPIGDKSPQEQKSAIDKLLFKLEKGT